MLMFRFLRTLFGKNLYFKSFYCVKKFLLIISTGDIFESFGGLNFKF